MRGVHKVDKNKFIDAYNKWANRELTIVEAAKAAEMSYPTFYKYVSILLTGGEFPENLFK